MATIAQQNAISALYIALFNRAPDAEGFKFWTDGLDSGATLPATANAFLASPEALDIYSATQTPAQFVATFYQTVFGRAPDTGGLAFWTGVLNTASENDPDTAKAVLVSRIIDVVSTSLPVKPTDLSDALYAQTVADRDLFGKKVVAGLGYAVDQQGNDLDAARKVIADLMRPPTPEPTPEPTPGPVTPPPLPGETFVLTTGTDTPVGTNRSDIFDAGLTENDEQTLGFEDSLDGGAGKDTLLVTLNTQLNVSSMFTPTLNNIEVIRATAKAGADNILNLSKSSGVTDVGSDGSEIPYAFINVGKAALSVSNQTQDVTFTGSTATALALTLNNVGEINTPIDVLLSRAGGFQGAQATTHNIVATDAYARIGYGMAGETVTTVTVKAEGRNQLTLAAVDADTVTNLIVTGKGSVDFGDQAFSALTTFTAGDGGVTLTSDNTTAGALTIRSGAGADSITANAASISSLQTGAGNDIVELLGPTLGSTATVDLGAGDDSLRMDLLPTLGNRINGGQGRDTLFVDDTSFNATSINLVRGFEVLAIQSQASTFDLDVSAITAMSEFWLASPGTSSFTNARNTTKFEIASNATAIKIANASGQTQTDITLNNRNMGQVDLTIDSLDVTSITTLSLTSVSAGSTGTNLITELLHSDNATITVKGDADLRFALDTATAQGSTVDASTFTGNLNVTGSAFNDVITGGTGDDIIDGGVFTIAALPGVTESAVVTWQGFRESGLQSGASQAAAGLYINVDQYVTSPAMTAVEVAAFVNGGSSATLSLSGNAGDQVGNWKFAAGDAPGTTVFTSITPNANVLDITEMGNISAVNTVSGLPTVEITQGHAATLATTNGSFDSLTGGGGRDTFVFRTPDADSNAGTVTAIIKDFEVGVDRIQVSGGGSGARSATTLVRATPTDVSDLTTLLSAADATLNGTVKYFLGQFVDAGVTSTYLVTDGDGVGYTNVIKLVGVSMDSFLEADLIAALP